MFLWRSRPYMFKVEFDVLKKNITSGRIIKPFQRRLCDILLYPRHLTQKMFYICILLNHTFIGKKP